MLTPKTDGRVISLARASVRLVAATHPEPSFAISAATTALALGAGLGPRSGWVAAAVLCGQFSLGWTNDYLDRDRDRLAQRGDKPLAAGEVDASVVRTAAIGGFALAVLFSLPLGLPATGAHVFGLLMGQVHNFGLKLTPWSVVPFALGFAAIPPFIALALAPPRPLPGTLMLAAACVGAGAHFTNELRDLEADRVTGAGGLPRRIGPVASVAAAAVLLAAGAVVAALATPAGSGLTIAFLAVALAAVVGVAVLGASGRRLWAYRLTYVAGLTAVANLVLAGARVL